MSKETYYFSHDYNARNDLKMALLREDYGMEGVGIYWCLVEMLYEEGGYIELDEIESITKVLRTNTTVLRGVIDSKLFQKDDKYFFSAAVLKRLQERQNKSEKARQSVLKRYERITTEYDRIRPNTIKERKGKESIKESIKEKNTPTIEKVKKTFYSFKENGYSDIKGFDNQFQKFCEYWFDGKRKLKNPTLACHNWLDKAREYQTKNKSNQIIPHYEVVNGR